MTTESAVVPAQRKSPVLVIVIAVVLLVAAGGGGYTWYYFSGPCGVNTVAAAEKAYQSALSDFSDAQKIAQNTARIGLAAPVQKMQDLRKAADGITHPGCLDRAHGNLLKSMDSVIEAMLAFMGQQSDSQVSSYFTDAISWLQKYTDEMERVKACAPNCG